ncbi:hypothetical protein CC78DRAFT_534008 [Lojkania enalia]|uniref:Glyoxalase/fosfomycin resistance/dioxygenase domain-containing protein n=1 Tax=Lojkania enalia TaxID=147567 RepID=A0A9P4KBD6_9PLEO|nr:hypothetical protein CC78DRAFT_534008 [Didymosphaeria enalia]
MSFAPTIFVNIPITSLETALPFYKALGMTQNMTWSSEDTACMSLSPVINIMLMTTPRFRTFLPPTSTSAPSTPPTTTGSPIKAAIFCITVTSKEAVDRILDAAEKAGGSKDPTKLPEMGGGYGRSVEDIDGHLWEVAWIGGMGEEGC